MDGLKSGQSIKVVSGRDVGCTGRFIEYANVLIDGVIQRCARVWMCGHDYWLPVAEVEASR